MQEKHLFEYAVIRVVPRVEREEFMNVGVILYCKKQQFLQAIFTLEEKKLQALCEKTDPLMVHKYLAAFQQIAQGVPNASPISRLDAASRFRWLTATRSTVIQTSKVHPGFCADPQEALQHLYLTMVL
jgi:hypothetical protein